MSSHSWVRAFVPIIVQPIIFRRNDGTNAGKVDASVECNPALCWDVETKRLTVAVRNVTYRKFGHNLFVLLSPPVSQTIYTVGTASLENLADVHELSSTIEQMQFTQLEINGDVPRYRAMWAGPEDIRFVGNDGRRVLFTAANLHPSGVPRMYCASVHERSIAIETAFELGGAPEKNWMPFQDGQTAVHSLTLEENNHVQIVTIPLQSGNSPTTTMVRVPMIRSADHSADDSQVDRSAEYSRVEQLRGSSNLVEIKIDENRSIMWCLVHENVARKHRWMKLVTESGAIVECHLSRAFAFFTRSHDEFVCSLSTDSIDTFVAGLGVDDCKAFAVVCSIREIEHAFFR